MLDQGTLIHYGELALKKKNRGRFIKQLADNIEKKTGGNVGIYEGRLYMEGGDPDALKRVFGISWYAPGYKVERSVDSITSALFEILDNSDTDNKSFGLFVRRSDKRFRPDSPELSRIVGQKIVDRYSMKVDLDNPDIPIHIEIAQKAFICFSKVNGTGGLPVGVTGSVLSLLSGGIDSPVSSYLLMKKGCDVDFIHFHTYPENTKVLETKINRIADEVSKYQNNASLFLVPYKVFQMGIYKNNIPDRYEMVLFRSFMFRLSSHMAKKRDYKAIVTGDSLSQVASQTIENLSVTNSSCTVPVFQPLISFDKEEIIELAERIGTYDLSILKYNECCSILSNSPKTRASIERINTLEEELDMNRVVEESLALVEEYELQ